MRRVKLAVIAVFSASLAAPDAVGGENPPPNILHIHADDHRPDGLHALGTDALQTPNLDKLVERGTTFSRCYTMGSMVGAVCLPSRTMMLTGRSWLRIPGGKAATDPWDPSMALPSVLSDAGYQTFHVGKSGNEFKAGIKAFQQSIVMDDRGIRKRRGSSERHADAVIRFLGESDQTRPFYVYMAPPVPHDPRVAAPEFMDRYSPDVVLLSEAFMPVHPFNNGEMTVRDERLAPWPRTPRDTRSQLADYYACITGLDHHVGRIVEQLRSTGQLENTIVIFSGDNGLSMGEHGLFGKQNLYEFGGMHCPLVIAGPGVPERQSDAFVYLMDLFPTLCELGGAAVPKGVEGQSLVPLLKGSEPEPRSVLYTAYRDCQRSVRDDRWKLIRYPQINKTQLFDLDDDPRELRNLADDPAYASEVARMTGLLKQEMLQYGDSTPLTTANPRPAEWMPPKTKKPATGDSHVRLHSS
ncbi:sulfatase-like hydrolase/transferase [Posidoniimonas corsicana]|uniref:sulfatase-like hydrolase/transferase n=1 Tax=Posidoniimonas corsicana TaxID=1938618 RepID=UPI0018D4B7EB|nr:sulfatase-like hydrolase/transferase [Posidoniimonas corsicana]